MALEKGEIKLIPIMYRSAFEEVSLFSWVEGQKRLIPAMSVEKSIELWAAYMGGDWNYDTLRTSYFRMQKKYYDAAKNV